MSVFGLTLVLYLNMKFTFIDFLIAFLLEICDNTHIKHSCEILTMSVNYNKLWKLLIDKNMKKVDLRTVQISAPVRLLN